MPRNPSSPKTRPLPADLQHAPSDAAEQAGGGAPAVTRPARSRHDPEEPTGLLDLHDLRAGRSDADPGAESGRGLHGAGLRVRATREASAQPRELYVQPRGVRVERVGAAPLHLALYADREYLFGRGGESHVVLPDSSVSRLHGLLSFSREGRWVFRDLSSRNGSYLSQGVAQPEDGSREPVRRIPPQRDQVLKLGQSVVLAHLAARLVLTAEPPASDGLQVGTSAASRRLAEAVQLNAHMHLPVFLLGLSGSGKTHTARAIHDASGCQGPFVLINCARLPDDPLALHSELLGHERGAFTEARSERLGKLPYAHQGTLFLDEVESLPPRAQQFLLDVLEGSGSFLPLGADAGKSVMRPRFRLIAASKKPLAQSGLRPDLCQRLSTGRMLVLPTLEERRVDIPALVQAFLERLHAEQDVRARFDGEALEFMARAEWPGQVRQLESTVQVVVETERARMRLAGLEAGLVRVGRQAVEAQLSERALVFGEAEPPVARAPSGLSTRPVGRAEVEAALALHAGNKSRAARALGIAVNTLKARLKER